MARHFAGKKGWLLGSTIVVVSVVALGLTFGPVGEALAEQVRNQLWTDASSHRPSVTVDLPSYADLVEELSPSVVSITVIQNRPIPRGHPLEDFFRFFGRGMPQSRRQGLGTGFIINAQGHILTNSHVVENAQQVTVQLHDGTELPAEIVSIDPPTDIALLRVRPESRTLPVAVLGDSDALRIGDPVVAIGNPFGLDYTVTSGIVSALERRQVNPEGRGGYHNYIQTDASINPGNSGGPLFNLRGEVVGINGAINAAGQGIGFAIPINMAKTMLNMMDGDGVIRRSWMGVGTQSMDPTLARSFGLTGAPRGALITEVVSGSPAAGAGLRVGDIVLEFNGQGIDRADDLPWLASTAGVGRQIPLVIWRDGRRRTIRMTLGEHPIEPARPPSVSTPQRSSGSGLGLTVGPLHPTLVQRTPGITGGLMVTGAAPEGQGAEAGFQRGDVIVAINGRPVLDPDGFQRAQSAMRAGQIVRFRVIRNGRPHFLALEYR